MLASQRENKFLFQTTELSISTPRLAVGQVSLVLDPGYSQCHPLRLFLLNSLPQFGFTQRLLSSKLFLKSECFCLLTAPSAQYHILKL